MPKMSDFYDTPKDKKNLEIISDGKPCSQCDQDSLETYWDSDSTTMIWTCINGHENSFVVK